jgi:hypothetical protein
MFKMSIGRAKQRNTSLASLRQFNVVVGKDDMKELLATLYSFNSSVVLSD